MTATNAFAGKTRRPTAKEINAELGPSKPCWDALLADLRRESRLKAEWHSYSVKTGWTVRMKSGERNVLYMSPLKGRIRAALVFGDRAVKMALASDLPTSAKRLVKSGTRYAEGTAVRMMIGNAKDVEVAKKLVAIKLAN